MFLMLLSLIMHIGIHELYWNARSPIHFKVNLLSPRSCAGAKIKLQYLISKLCIGRCWILDLVSSYNYAGYLWHKAPGGNTAPTISAKISNTNFAWYGGDWCSHLVDTVSDHIAKYQELKEAVRNGELGDIGRFWIKYMDCIWLFV